MVPGESNPPEFVIAPGVSIDSTMFLVDEAKQVDTLIINNIDVRGNLPSVGILTSDQFVGMNMANEITILSIGPFSGITYSDIEVVVINLGDGVDHITVENTSEGEKSVLTCNAYRPFCLPTYCALSQLPGLRF